MKKPYVISAELDLASSTIDGIIQNNQLDRFRESLDADLRNCDKQTEWVSSGQLRTGIEKLTAAARLPVVSLDDRYLRTADTYLGISRGIDLGLNDAGYTARFGYPDIEKQLDSIIKVGTEVVLADDVLFSGDMALNIANALAMRKVKVRGFLCGIAIREGVDKLAAENIDVSCVREFDDVEDEICERDFALIHGSGRKLANVDAQALYFDSLYGKPEAWASIPQSKIGDFCVKSLQRNLKLLNPDVPIEAIGTFVGYEQAGTALQVLRNRIGAEQ